MPVYEYECGKCVKVFELQQRVADAPLRVCPDCGGEVHKLISRSSFQLKGGGWYSDGYSGGATGKSGDSAPAGDATAATPPCQGGSGSCCQCPASR